MKSFDAKLSSLTEWQPPAGWLKITTLDAHTGGEPLRIITSGFPEIKGSTMLDKRRYVREHLDHYRKMLMWEPRGHADMYGCILTAPVSPEADFGVLFMHNEGYSTMCGHGIIAVTKIAVECGLVSKTEPETCVKIDSPAGLITAYAKWVDGKVNRVYFYNVPSYVVALNESVEVPGLGNVKYDLAFGGAYYAFVSAKDVGVGMATSDYRSLIEKGMAIKRAVMQTQTISHPFQSDLNFLYGTIFTGDGITPGADSRNVCVFADGEVDRSPTGTGVSARMALQFAKGELSPGESMTIESIVGSNFKCSIKEVTKFGPYQAVIPEVEGSAYIWGNNTFVVDPEDPLKAGFILR